MVAYKGYITKLRDWCIANNIPEDVGGLTNYDTDGYMFDDTCWSLLFTANDGIRYAIALNLNYDEFIKGQLYQKEDGSWYRGRTTEIPFDNDGIDTVKGWLAQNTNYSAFPSYKFN